MLVYDIRFNALVYLCNHLHIHAINTFPMQRKTRTLYCTLNGIFLLKYKPHCVFLHRNMI